MSQARLSTGVHSSMSASGALQPEDGVLGGDLAGAAAAQVAVDAVGVGLEQLAGLGLEGRQLLLGDPPPAHRPDDLVGLEPGRPDELGEPAGGDVPAQVHLEEPLLGVDVALRPREVGERVAVDVRDAAAVALDGDRGREPRQRGLPGAGGQGVADRGDDDDAADQCRDDDEREESQQDATGDDEATHPARLGHHPRRDEDGPGDTPAGARRPWMPPRPARLLPRRPLDGAAHRQRRARRRGRRRPALAPLGAPLAAHLPRDRPGPRRESGPSASSYDSAAADPGPRLRRARPHPRRGRDHDAVVGHPAVRRPRRRARDGRGGRQRPRRRGRSPTSCSAGRGRSSLLIGAVVASTDAAAVFSVLRRVPLPRRISGMLEAESGFNDAPVVLLVTALAAGLAPGAEPEPWWHILLVAVLELAGGTAVGLAVGWLGARLMRLVATSSSALFAIGVLSVAVLAYAAADSAAHLRLHRLLPRRARPRQPPLPHRPAVIGFAAAIGWLAQIGLFVLLGLLASPERASPPSWCPPSSWVPPCCSSVAAAVGARLVHAVPDPVAHPGLPLVGRAAGGGARRPRDRPGDRRDTRAWSGCSTSSSCSSSSSPLIQAPTLPWVARRLGLGASHHRVDLAVEATPLTDLGAELLEIDVGPESRIGGRAGLRAAPPPRRQRRARRARRRLLRAARRRGAAARRPAARRHPLGGPGRPSSGASTR